MSSLTCFISGAGPCWERPLQRRGEALRELPERLQKRYAVFSEGLIGAGRAFFAAMVAQGQEAIMAKQLAAAIVQAGVRQRG